MIKRLRRKMAGLNALISSVILLAMALVALYISDSVLVAQYQEDLVETAASFHTIIDDPLVSFSFTYAAENDSVVYYEEDGQGVIAGSAAADDREGVTQAVLLARAKAKEQIERTAPDLFPADLTGEFTYRRSFVDLSTNSDATVLADTDDVEAAPISGFSFSFSVVQEVDEVAIAPDETGAALSVRESVTVYDLSGGGTESLESVTYDLPQMIVSGGGTSYRVAPSLLSGDTSGLFFVFQDRTEERAARMRLRLLFLGCALGGLILAGIASLLFGKRAVRPIERSIEQQRAFVASASHELRTPVAALSANVEVLRDAELGEFEPFRQAIEQETARMGHLVGDLIDLARADAGVLHFADEFVDVEEAALHTAKLMRPLAERKGIELFCATEPAWIRGDDARLRQALVALIDNAIRYTQSGGHVWVKARQVKRRVILSVADDGPGIPDAHKQKVFERFYRVDPARAKDGGSGLGLSVAGQIVERMGGTISVRDGETGRGCVFEMVWKTG